MPNVFPLASVLALRQQAEAAEERALSAAHAKVVVARATLAGLLQRIQAHSNQRITEVQGTFSAAHHQASALHWRALCEQQLALEQQLQSLEQNAREQQRRFVSSRRDREMLSELYEKHESDYKAAQEKDERKRIDDLFIARRWLRK